MVKTVKVQQAKTHLSALLAEVEAGAEVVIARGNVPVAALVPYAPPADRELGLVSYRVPEAFFDPLPATEIDAWER